MASFDPNEYTTDELRFRSLPSKANQMLKEQGEPKRTAADDYAAYELGGTTILNDAYDKNKWDALSQKAQQMNDAQKLKEQAWSYYDPNGYQDYKNNQYLCFLAHLIYYNYYL